MVALVLVAGISGVGKTTLCRQFCNVTGTRYLSASSHVWHGSDFSQLSLTRKLRDAFDEVPMPTILDGHLIVDGHGVAAECIEMLEPAGIVVVVAPPEQISMRRSSDPSRTRVELTKDEISLAQEAEISWAHQLARQCNVVTEVVQSQDEWSFGRAVLRMLSSETKPPEVAR